MTDDLDLEWRKLVERTRRIPDNWASIRWQLDTLEDPSAAFKAEFLRLKREAERSHVPATVTLVDPMLGLPIEVVRTPPGVNPAYREALGLMDLLVRAERVRQADAHALDDADRPVAEGRTSQPAATAGGRLISPARLAEIYPAAVASVHGRRTWDKVLDAIRELEPAAPDDSSTLRRYVKDDHLPKPRELP